MRLWIRIRMGNFISTASLVSLVSNTESTGSGGSSPKYMGEGHSPMASAAARAYNGGLGAESPAGLKHFWFWTFNENRKFAHFSKIWKRKDRLSDVCVIFAKSHGWPRNWGSRKKLGPLPPPRPGPKPPLSTGIECGEAGKWHFIGTSRRLIGCSG